MAHFLVISVWLFIVCWGFKPLTRFGSRIVFHEISRHLISCHLPRYMSIEEISRGKTNSLPASVLNTQQALMMPQTRMVS